MSVPRTIGMRETRYQAWAGRRGLTDGTSLVFSGSTPPCLASASSREANGPSFTSSHSSTACVCRICFHVRRIVDAGHLHQQLGFGIAAAGGLHRGFGQTQAR